MSLMPIFPNVHALALGPVNVFLLEEEDGLTVIDTGYAGSMPRILEAAKQLGYPAKPLRQIVLTHCHPDHAGSVAALVEATGAQVWAHHLDAEVVRGNTKLAAPPKPSPGILNAILYRFFIAGANGEYPHAPVDHEVADGELLAIGGGLRAYHTPGHSPGHLALLLERDGGLLFAGDACSNMPSLGLSIVYDDLAAGRRSLARLATLDYAAICFGHGSVLRGEAVQRFKRKWN
jgi:glyoxylase-like metal-dependent hydrolase (beta-lactamase superfamily II)